MNSLCKLEATQAHSTATHLPSPRRLSSLGTGQVIGRGLAKGPRHIWGVCPAHGDPVSLEAAQQRGGERILALPPCIGCVTFGKLLHLSVPKWE